MNQVGFVEVAIVRNELVYRLQVPMGVDWMEVHAAIMDIAGQIDTQVKEYEKAEQLKKEQENVVLEPEVVGL